MVLRPGSAHLDPLDERGDLGVFQLAGGGHLQGLALDGVDKLALAGVARNHCRASVSALENAGAAVEMQLGEQRLRLGAMTLVAVGRQQRPHLRLKELDLLG